MRIEGTVEDIVYRNDENGYTVMTIKSGNKKISVVGTLPEAVAGERAVIEGEEVEHPDYGYQIKASSCELLEPDTKHGMEKFLASGYIRGVGPVTAKLIMKHFGKDAFDVLENEPHRLEELPGIGPKKVKMIATSFAEHRAMRQTIAFLQTYGMSTAQASRIYEEYGANAPDIIRKDPYRMVREIRGIGFATADALARSLGISENAPSRIQAGIHYVIDEATNSMGHCYLPYDMLLDEASRVLRVQPEIVENAVREQLLAGELLHKSIGEDDAVYTASMYRAENEVAQRLIGRIAAKIPKLPGGETRIERYEQENGVQLSEQQRNAVLTAANGGLVVITGGPGTGKTTCIRCMLEVLSGAGKIVLCAPTGRAAKRMSEASGCDAKTIHRMLEYGGDDMLFQINEDNPLPADVVIVDEVSMCDLFLMRALLRALKDHTRLILVGDADQLPPVGAGNVLGDLIASGIAPVVRLTRIYRQENGSRIVDNAHRINAGELPVCNGKGSDFFFERYSTAQDAAKAVVKLVSERLPAYLHVDPITSIQTMAPMKKGEVGVIELNRLLQNALNPQNAGNSLTRGDTQFREGDRVMQVNNDYQREWEMNGESGTGVFNGDIGYIIRVDRETRTLQIRFEDDRIAEYEDKNLNDLELAYCMSVHKSQGGEFDAVVMPLVNGPAMLMTRNLLYTAVTRAKRLVVLVGRESCIAAMVQNDKVIKRYSGLCTQLQTMSILISPEG